MLLGPCTTLSTSVPTIPPLIRICLCRTRNLTEHTRSRFARRVCWSQATLCRRPGGPCSLLGLFTPASRGPDLSWCCRRSFHKTPPNELDRHVTLTRGLRDHPSQCSQHWPVDTISVVAIRRVSDHHVTASSMIPWAHLTDVASSQRLRLHDPTLDSAESSTASAVSGSFKTGIAVH